MRTIPYAMTANFVKLEKLKGEKFAIDMKNLVALSVSSKADLLHIIDTYKPTLINVGESIAKELGLEREEEQMALF